MSFEAITTVLNTQKKKRLFIVSLVISLLLVPVFDSLVIQRDRNRNMAYGEIFWQKGFGVYDLTDNDLNQTYDVPADHLLLGNVNVSYEYPVVALLFYAGLAAIEPGSFQPSHIIVNVVLLFILHLNFILFLAIGREYCDRRWFQEIFLLYYLFESALTIVFAKIEPLADLFLLLSIFFIKNKQGHKAGLALGLAVQTKFYPTLALPLMIAEAPIVLVGVIGISVVAMVPYLMNDLAYTSVLNHFTSSPAYSGMITNPYYIGLAFTNPLGIVAPLVILAAFLYATFETRKWRGLLIPTGQLRTHDWRALYAYITPMVLVLFAWTMVWYLMWFILLFFLLKTDSDRERFRWVIASMWIAYALGYLCNLSYFLAEPFRILLLNFRFL
ncbi:MAG: hypothetical protein K9W43_10600 [Candidatus Thorarchaeota archaeon]|nr:hypothetical protein [Candidatus Thorarchaeota archaeon]